MIQTGVRVSELTGLRVRDTHLGTGAHIRVAGKGRKKRATTLTGETVKVMRQWLTERHGQPADPLFPGPAGTTAQPLYGRRGGLKARRQRHAPAGQRRGHRDYRTVARP
jgi:site-specific recombinase XerC